MPAAELEAAVERVQELLPLEEELQDLALLLARAMTDSGNRTELEKVLAHFGYTREQLEAIPDEE